MITFKSSCCLGLLVGLASFVQPADKTWTGKISDSMCRASHTKMMSEHKDARTDRDCTLACIRRGGQYESESCADRGVVMCARPSAVTRLAALAAALPALHANGDS